MKYKTISEPYSIKNPIATLKLLVINYNYNYYYHLYYQNHYRYQYRSYSHTHSHIFSIISLFIFTITAVPIVLAIILGNTIQVNYLFCHINLFTIFHIAIVSTRTDFSMVIHSYLVVSFCNRDGYTTQYILCVYIITIVIILNFFGVDSHELNATL